jgi:hypothetical protein
VQSSLKHPVPDVVDTIRRRSQCADTSSAVSAMISGEPPTAADLSSINRARFSALSARLAQLSAKASADSLAQPACAHDPVPMEDVARLLTDLRRIADTIADIAAGHCPINECRLHPS